MAQRRDVPGVDPTKVNDETSLRQVLTSLLAVPASLSVAMRSETDGGLPSSGGLYAWWASSGALPGVPSRPHPTLQELDIIYVGIAPSREGSTATLRSRVIGNHMRGNMGSSTFRLTLAALLLEQLELRPVHPSDRPILTREDNAMLSSWQREHLGLTWAVHPEPWRVEAEVIHELQPPLNLAQNASHPFHASLAAARARLRRVSRGKETA
jgi:hypothetical protein